MSSSAKSNHSHEIYTKNEPKYLFCKIENIPFLWFEKIPHTKISFEPTMGATTFEFDFLNPERDFANPENPEILKEWHRW